MVRMRRVACLLLTLVMVIGMLPMYAFRADAADTTQYLFFATDRHENTSIIDTLLDQVSNVGTVEFACLGGDMVNSQNNYNTSTVLGEVASGRDQLTAANVDIVAGNHDEGANDDAGIFNGSSGWLYSGEDYHVYGVVWADVEENSTTAEAAAQAFVSWASALTDNKVIIVMSHMPLHSKRGDNTYAPYWHTALNTVATGSENGTTVQRDVIFLHGHNHTNETTNYAYSVGQGYNVEGAGTVTNYYTYGTAGYLNANKEATLIAVNDSTVTLTRYKSSGTAEQYASVTRVASTDSGEGETTTETKEVYVLVDTMTVGKDYLIANGNSGTVTLLGQSSGSETTTTAEVKTSGDYTYIESAGDGYVWNATAHTNSSYSSYPRLINAATYAMYPNSGSLAFSNSLTSTSGAVYTRYWTYSDGQLAAISTNNSTTYYLTYSDGYAMTSTATDGIYIYEKQTITVSSDGTVSGGGSTEGGDSGDSGDSGNTGGSTETVVGDGTYTTADDDSYQKVTFGSSTTEEKTVYVLTDTMTSGENYLIVDSNSTSGNALINSSNSVGNTTVTITSGSLTIDGATSTETYIVLDNSSAVWTAGTSGSDGAFKNNGYYLYHKSGNLSLVTSTGNTNWTWNGSSNYLYYSGGGTKYLVYNDGWVISETADNVYLYREETATVTTGSSVTYSVTASDIEHFYTADETDTETATITKSVTSGTPDGTYSYEILSDEDSIISGDIASDGTITFNGNEGTAQVKVSYTWTEGENTYTIWQVIDVTATAPYYKVELHKKNDDGTLELIEAPIALKGVEANDTYSVWAVVKYYDGIIEDGEDGKDLGDLDDDSLYWVVSDPSIATIDPATGVITFTGENYGTFDVTVYYRDADGNILCEDTITISATESQYVVPGDGTDDFPEYPEQGAIRFDKTAVAQGNFSQSGIAKVELSMTGVPYGTSAKTDVVIMVDMTASMSDDDVTAAEEAVKELIESLVYDEENDKYDSNIQLFIDVFYSASSDSAFSTEEYMAGTTISNATELTAAKALIDFTQSSQGGGTRYNLAMKDVYETLNRDGHADNQFVVFVSDGVATAYAPLTNGTLGTTITGSNSETESLAAGWFDSEGEVTDEFETEYYSYLIKTAGIPVYTVGANLTALSDAADVLNHMSSNYSPDGKTATGETKYSFFCTTSGGITDEVLEIFHGIGEDIREAATNVVVEDKIDSHYTMNFSLPSGVTADEAGMDDFYIQVLGYELDENNDRKADPTVLEKFLFNYDGTITHTIGTTTCESCTHVTKDSTDKITAIDGTYFDYTVAANGDEFLTWTAEKLDRTELALEYFVYLDHSAGEDAADQVAPGTYPTNEYATITYTNFNGKECQQYFPVPTMTWMGAKVTYVFYLVNEDGQPVNRAGKIIPFAEAIFVTDPVTYDVTWNEAAGIEKLEAAYLAQDKVPEVYQLYDDQAYYEILVYQTEGVDSETSAVNYNHFIIEGSSSVANKETTKVYNTKAGDRFDDYGAYSATAGSYTSTKSGTSYTATVTTDIDYANTTVAFAVVWKPELVPDTVVVDYGLDVVIDVTTNDSLASGVTGVSTTAPANVEVNKGTYKNSAMGTSTNILIDDLIVGTAKVENLNAVRFSLNKSSGMQFNEPVEFFYESECNYYTYDKAGNRTLNTAFMYSSVTVIPATSIYYEDEYVTLTTHTKQEDGSYVETSGWPTSSIAANAEQDVDRPGEGKISEAYDADNNYGYDSAYTSMSTYSMGKAAKITVTPTVEGQAAFDFYGTGFDVISLTSNTTGTIAVQVYAYDEDGTLGTEPVKSYAVDTYYGYSYPLCKVVRTYSEENGWTITSETPVETAGESEDVPENPKNGDTYTEYTYRWINVSSNDPNALYQVPVMKVEGLTYGKYRARIVVFYDTFFDHVSNDSAYDFYLDAIRIYDPTGNLNDTANDAYVQDGEGWPTYDELRDMVISQSTYNDGANEDAQINGLVFIDGLKSGAGNTASVADYVSYGPNNELYLTNQNAVIFDLANVENVAKIQIAVKTVGGTGAVKISGQDTATGKTVVCVDTEINSATDMYYDITDLMGMTVTIENTGDAVISITNVKTTYTSDPSQTAAPLMLFSVRRSSVDAALATMSVEEEVTEPETEPTEPETEATEPETEPTEPETEATEPETEPTEPETEATEPETEPTEPETEPSEPSPEEKVEEVIRVVKKIIKGFLGWLFG